MNQLDELADMLDKTAQTIGDSDQSIHMWKDWVEYLLEALESLAIEKDYDYPMSFELMLEGLRADISNRLHSGHWRS